MAADGYSGEIVKALVVESTARVSAATPEKTDDVGVRGIGDIVPPPYDLEALARLHERSPLLRPCVEAMVVNVGGSFGFSLVPEIDFNSPTIDREIWRAIVLEKLADGQPPIVTDEMVKARKLEAELEAELEKARLDIWFLNAAAEMSFMELCQRRVRAQEIVGGAFWEILRDRSGEPAKVKHLPATSMRFTPYEDEEVEIEAPERVSALAVRMSRERKKVRRYVQLSMGVPVTYFKAFGDRRIMSADTGRFYSSEAEMRAKEGATARVATEVYYFDQLSTELTDYGVPRWIGATMAVLGSRECEEANYLFWTNNGIPEVIITVAGGKPAQDLQQQVVNYLRERKGQQIRWSPLVLTAESGPGAAAMAGSAAGSQARINVIPLRTSQGDALGQAYEKDNARKVQQQWRLPDLLVGRSEEANKAQADAARSHAEEQIFIPERMLFDAVMNRILAAKGIRYWRFESNGPKSSDPPELVLMVTQVCTAGIITPAEARELVGPAFGRVFDRLDFPWTRLPLEWFKAQMQPPPSAAELAAQQAQAAEGAATDGETKPSFQPAPTDAAKVIRVDEVRTMLGFKPIGGERGALFLSELEHGAPAGAQVPGKGAPPEKASLKDTVRKILETRAELQVARESIEKQALEDARKGATGGEAIEKVEVPATTWARWFEE